MGELLEDIEKEWKNRTIPKWEDWLSRPECALEEDLVCNLLRDVKNPRILDIGCGSGRYALCLNYQEYVGLDIQESNIKFAEELTQHKGPFINARFVKGSMFDPWPIEPDVVLTISVFRHFKDPVYGYQEVWNRLPKGCIWVTSFLTYEGRELKYDGKFSSLLPEDSMRSFIADKNPDEPINWFYEVGDWWLVRMQKDV